MISRVEMVDRPQQCTRRDASDPRDAVSRRPGQRRALEQTGRALEQTRRTHLLLLLCRFSFGARPLPWPAPIGSTACRGSAFLPRTAPTLVCSSPIGRKMTHTLIWRAAEAKRFVTIYGAKSTPKRTPPEAWNSRHARMPASTRRMPRAECCCCCR